MTGDVKNRRFEPIVQNAEQVCKLDISIQGRAMIEREVQAPHFETHIDIMPQDVESVM